MSYANSIGFARQSLNDAHPERKRNARPTGKVIAVGGGKGGIGKSLMSLLFGVGIARKSRDVVIIDADFGGANLHTMMRVLRPEKTLDALFSGQEPDLNKLTAQTSEPGLRVIYGAAGVLGMSNFKNWERYHFLTALRNLDTEYTIMDLGAGSSPAQADLFLAADCSVLVTTPELPAIQDCYGFLKNCLFRRLQLKLRKYPEVVELLEEYKVPSSFSSDSEVQELVGQIRDLNSRAVTDVLCVLQRFRPKLILNMAHEDSDVICGYTLQKVALEHLGIRVDYWGPVLYDARLRDGMNGGIKLDLLDEVVMPSKSFAEMIGDKILNNERVRLGYRERAKISSLVEPPSRQQLICSCQCKLWGECNEQRGGYPCRIAPIGHIMQER